MQIRGLYVVKIVCSLTTLLVKKNVRTTVHAATRPFIKTPSFAIVTIK